jgi:UDP-N-acetyl-D-glucosamine dehydrogenase
MPSYLVQRAARLLAGAGLELAGSTVLLLGVAYKAGVPDTRESATLRVAAGLTALGARVRYHDPVTGPVPELGPPVSDLDSALRDADVTVLLVGHGGYDLSRLARNARLLLDVTGHVLGEEVHRL